jgi:hypothetical protein
MSDTPLIMRSSRSTERRTERLCVLGGVAQPGEPRQVEEAAAALDRVDEAEDRIEPRAIARIGLPTDDLTRERLQRLACLGDEFLQQIVHAAPSPPVGERGMARRRLKGCLLRERRRVIDHGGDGAFRSGSLIDFGRVGRRAAEEASWLPLP